MNFADIPDNILGEKKEGELSPREKKIAERLVLELYCQFEPSIPFREVISAEVSNDHVSNLSVLKFFPVILCAVNVTIYLEQKVEVTFKHEQRDLM